MISHKLSLFHGPLLEWRVWGPISQASAALKQHIFKADRLANSGVLMVFSVNRGLAAAACPSEAGQTSGSGPQSLALLSGLAGIPWGNFRVFFSEMKRTVDQFSGF